jgi:hypothetical protein
MATAVASAEPGARRWRLRLPERLPDLNGKWLTLYTIVWAIVLPLSIVGTAWGCSRLLTTPTMWSPYGFATLGTSEGIYVSSVFSDAARATELEAGDYVVAIDGWPVPTTASRAAARTRVVKPDGSMTTFTIRKANGELFEATLVRSDATEYQRYREAGVSFPLARLLSFAGSILTPVLFIPAGVLLFVRRRREAVPACLSLAFLMLAFMWSGAGLLEISIDILEVVGAATGLLLFTALFAFPAGRFEPRWTAVPFLLLLATFWIKSELLDLAFQVLAVVVLVSRYRKVGQGAERLQLRWAFLGFVIGLLLSAAAVLVNWAAEAWAADDPRWLAWQYAFSDPLTTLSLCVMAIGLIVSILRYRLYDADAVIGRSAAYGMLTIGFVALFAASQKIIELLGEEYFGRNIGALAGGIGAALAAVAIAPMHTRAQHWAERRFQKTLYRLRHSLPLLVGDLRETSGLEQIAGATLDSLIEGVRACRAALIADDVLVDARDILPREVEEWRGNWVPPIGDGIDCDPSDLLFPYRVPLEAEGHGRVGWLLLGPRPDGSLFGKTERDAIDEIAEPVARAVQVALMREEREATYRRDLQSMERRVQGIEKRLARLLPGTPSA